MCGNGNALALQPSTTNYSEIWQTTPVEIDVYSIQPSSKCVIASILNINLLYRCVLYIHVYVYMCFACDIRLAVPSMCLYILPGLYQLLWWHEA